MSRISSPTSAPGLESGIIHPHGATPVPCLNGSRYAALALTLLVSMAMLSCQEYSSGLQRSVQRADETAAVAALHTVGMAQQTYSITGGDFGTFQQLCAGGLLDPRFDSSNPAIQDYVLTMEVTPKSETRPNGFFSCNADPSPTSGKVGSHFYIDSTSTELHVNPDRAATAKDPIAGAK